MKITVKVKPNARKNEVQHLEGSQYQVLVNVSPVDGKANEKLIELLSKFFHKPKRNITIVSGFTSKMKTVDIG